ncbi:MAG: GspE/PulE family protein [Patescibacteria group bacterium]
MIQFDEDKQNRRVADLRRKEEEDLVRTLAPKYGVEYIDLSATPVNTDALRLVDESKAREAKLAPFSLVDKHVKLAMRIPDDEKAHAIAKELSAKGFEIAPFIVSTASLEKAWKSYKDLSFAIETKAGSLEISNDEVSAIIDQAKSLPTIQSILQNTLSMKRSFRVSRILETILAGALAIGASDVHIEPEEGEVRLRYRLDGVLTDVLNFDHDTYKLLLSRVKLLSGLKLNIKQEPQDGRFSIKLALGDIEIRTSMLPGAYSESIVLRVLNPKSISTPLEELGIPPKLLSVILEAIDKPNGMLLTTGPTGSGKTTTLYALLKKIHEPTIKIITIEDPIEYHLPGITQTQTNDKGYNFLEGLRSALRQDPDVIMVGEIRDNETAAIAINSALTGHLVFSTLHTNNAAGAFPRLIDLGINPRVITSAVTIALAQRLVRRLCPACKKEKLLEGEEKRVIDNVLAKIVDRSLIPENTTKIWEPVGCEKCNKSGFKGRIGIYEGIIVNKTLEETIESSPSERSVAEIARPQGILNMEEDGITKILQGHTSLAELKRVIEVID